MITRGTLRREAAIKPPALFTFMASMALSIVLLLLFRSQLNTVNTMAPVRSLICIALSTTAITAFTATPIHQPRTNSHRCAPLFSDKDGGGAAIAAPKTKTVTTTQQKQKQKSEQKKKFKPSDPSLRSEDDFEDAPMYRLYLVGDESYEQEHVCTRLFEVIEDCSEDDAAALFKSAYQSGEAFMGKYPLEVAETYAEQLTRSDPIIYADVRDDKV